MIPETNGATLPLSPRRRIPGHQCGSICGCGSLAPHKICAASATTTSRSTAGGPRSATSPNSSDFRAHLSCGSRRTTARPRNFAVAGVIAHNGRLGKNVVDPRRCRGQGRCAGWDASRKPKVGDERRCSARPRLRNRDPGAPGSRPANSRNALSRRLALPRHRPAFYERQDPRRACLSAPHSPTSDDLAFERIVNVPRRIAPRRCSASARRRAPAALLLVEVARASLPATGCRAPRETRWPGFAALDAGEAAERHSHRSGAGRARQSATPDWQADTRLTRRAGSNLKELVVAMAEFDNLGGFLCISAWSWTTPR